MPLVVACVGRIRSSYVFRRISSPVRSDAHSRSCHVGVSRGGPHRSLGGGGDNRGGLEGLGGGLLLGSSRGGGRLNLDRRDGLLSGRLGSLGLGLRLGGGDGGDRRGLLGLLRLLSLLALSECQISPDCRQLR